MPRKDDPQRAEQTSPEPASEQPASEEQASQQLASPQQAEQGSQQPGTAVPTPAMEQLLSTLDQVFATFRQRSLDQEPKPFDDNPRNAVIMFNKVITGLEFGNPRGRLPCQGFDPGLL